MFLVVFIKCHQSNFVYTFVKINKFFYRGLNPNLVILPKFIILSICLIHEITKF